MSKEYAGVRREGACYVTVCEAATGAGARALPPRNDLRNHSPTGFNWGYSGSGPAQLALALCADALGDDERALRVYQAIKWRVVSGFYGDFFSISDAELIEQVELIERESGRLDPSGEQQSEEGGE